MFGRMNRLIWLIGVVLVSMVLSGCAGPSGLNMQASKPRTWQDIRYANVIRQKTDYTCGAAALSTLGQYYFGRNIAETDITNAIKAQYSPEDWRKREGEGLSMLDLKVAAEQLGFRAAGAQMSLAALSNLEGPIIVHLKKGYLQHFVVLRGVEGDRVYLADPSSGNVRMPVFRFMQEWTGYALMVWIDDQPLPTKTNLLVGPQDEKMHMVSVRRALYANSVPVGNRQPGS